MSDKKYHFGKKSHSITGIIWPNVSCDIGIILWFVSEFWLCGQHVSYQFHLPEITVRKPLSTSYQLKHRRLSVCTQHAGTWLKTFTECKTWYWNNLIHDQPLLLFIINIVLNNILLLCCYLKRYTGGYEKICQGT